VVHVNGVDVEVVVGVGAILGRPDVGFVEADVLEAVPLEDDLFGFDIHLLDDTLPDPAVPRAADRGEVRPPWGVGSQERGVPRGD
jgi:hypothetical protein